MDLLSSAQTFWLQKSEHLQSWVNDANLPFPPSFCPHAQHKKKKKKMAMTQSWAKFTRWVCFVCLLKKWKVEVLVAHHVQLLVTLWTVDRQAPLPRNSPMGWVAIPFSRVFSQPRDQTGVSCTAGRFCTVWATREALLFASEFKRKKIFFKFVNT